MTLFRVLQAQVGVGGRGTRADNPESGAGVPHPGTAPGHALGTVPTPEASSLSSGGRGGPPAGSEGTRGSQSTFSKRENLLGREEMEARSCQQTCPGADKHL